MRTASLRSIPLLLVVLVCCACSFRGSVGRADGTSSSSTGSEHTTSSSSAAPGTSTAGASGSTGAAGSTTPADGTPAGVDRCHTSELAGSLVPGSPGAGQRYATLVLRNSGGEACTIHGYGGLGLVDGDGHALPTHQIRLSDPPAATVTLQPGDTVSAQLHWGAVPGPGDASSGDCQPTPATLRVIPPDETDALSVAWDQGPVCEGGTIEQTAYAG